MTKLLFHVYSGSRFFVSCVINMVYWATHIHRVKHVFEIKKETASRVKNITDARLEMGVFKLTKSKTFDWFPWVITVIDKNLYGSCNGAAIYGKWLFKLLGIDSNIYNLKSKKCRHTVCITNNKKYMTTNELLINMHVLMEAHKYMDWKNFVYSWFKNKYVDLNKI